jgi:3-hydroxyacyl-CoA dehydrogenase
MLSTAMENVRGLAAWGRREPIADRQPAGRRKIGSVGILGAGMMGTAIAAAHALYRLPVVLYDANPNVLNRAGDAVAAELRRAGGHLTSESLRRLMRPSANLSDPANCDLVLESITESLSAKLELFAQLQKHLAGQTIVASNTSTIPLERLACGFGDPSRFCGMHFCHPVPQRPLVEIVYGRQTSNATIDAATAHVRRIGRIPMAAQDGPGFVVNRLLFPYLGAALDLLRTGAPAESIEDSAAEFGMAFGPLRLMDEIGLDTTLQAAWVLAAAFPERIASSPLLVSLIKAGRLGRKTGAGFFSYDASDGGRILCTVDKAIDKLMAPWIDSPSQRKPKDIIFRLILPMLLEATRILEEGLVRDARNIDLAVLFGLGFPAEKGGLLWWADSLGAERIVAMLSSFDGAAPGMEPTTMLKTLAKIGGQFYPSPGDWGPKSDRPISHDAKIGTVPSISSTP